VPDIILPDIYAYSKSGEKEMDFAMEWSEIPPVNHTQSVFLPDIAKLKTASENRVKNSETFKKIDNNAKRIQDRKEDTQYPLTLKEFRERDAKLLEESEKYKNLYTEIPTLKIDNLPTEQIADKDDTAKALRTKDQIKNLKKDPYLEETLAIMKDMTVFIAKK
jgi:carboxyl-terminal processing protease